MFETNQKKKYVLESGLDVETAYKVVLVLYLSTFCKGIWGSGYTAPCILYPLGRGITIPIG
jgi:hypothetical protein